MEKNLSSKEEHLSLLDSIARRHYSGYFSLVRDNGTGIEFNGFYPDIIAATSPSMKPEEIRVVAIVADDNIPADPPQSWQDLLLCSNQKNFRVDLYVPKNLVKRIFKWAREISETVRVLPVK